MYPPIAREIKEEILHKIKTEGFSVSVAAKTYGVSTKTIYGWLSKQNEKVPSILENSRLRRENQQLKEIIGLVTLELERSKKGQK